MDKNVVITGSTGFIGTNLIEHLYQKGCYQISSIARVQNSDKRVKFVNVLPIDGTSDLRSALVKQDVVIHLAAIAHKSSNNPHCKDYQKINTSLTLNLARQAAEVGVKRFVFLSSIGVNGQRSVSPFNEKSNTNPDNEYSKSKLEAEKGLWKIQEETGLEIVIIRPPLVYGFNAPGNFSSLLKALKYRFPFVVPNKFVKRSFISVSNLVDFIETCIHHPRAANQLFLISDGSDLSLDQFLKMLSAEMKVTLILLPIPLSIVYFIARLLNKSKVMDKLYGSLQIDNSKAREVLNWSPPHTVNEGIRMCFKRNFKC